MTNIPFKGPSYPCTVEPNTGLDQNWYPYVVKRGDKIVHRCTTERAAHILAQGINDVKDTSVIGAES